MCEENVCDKLIVNLCQIFKGECQCHHYLMSFFSKELLCVIKE